MFAQVFEAASEQHPDITFGKIDIEDQPGLQAAAGITSIPTLMVFRDGVLVFSQSSALPAKALEQVIQEVRDLDMVEVRGKLAARSRHQEPGGELRHQPHRGSTVRRRSQPGVGRGCCRVACGSCWRGGFGRGWAGFGRAAAVWCGA
jgi:thioredoxin 1